MEQNKTTGQKRATVCIVGAGLSSLILLRSLVNAATSDSGMVRLPLSVIIIDENSRDQFGCGVAYADPWEDTSKNNRGSRAELLNSPAARMNLESAIGPDGDFVHWLQQHQPHWQKLLGLVRKSEGRKIEFPGNKDRPGWETRGINNWLAFNQAKLAAGEYGTVYFPRCVYGAYLKELAQSTIATALSAGINVVTIESKATRFTADSEGKGPYRVSIDSVQGAQDRLNCDIFVYAGGDLTPGQLAESNCNPGTVAEFPYAGNPHRYERIATIKTALGQPGAEVFKLVLAGCNASAMDQLWGLSNDPEIMAALTSGRMKIVVIAPGEFPHSGVILEPATSAEHVDPLRWIQESEQQLLDKIMTSHLNTGSLSKAADYFAAVKRSIKLLRLEQNPHLFMSFLRRLGEVEQTIKDGLDDIENFAQNYHCRLEALLSFTPYEYWRVVAQTRLMDGALEKIDGKVTAVCKKNGQLRVSASEDVIVSCNMFINCTGTRNPFHPGPHSEFIDELVAAGFGFNNHTGGLAASLEGRIKLADGCYAESAYICTQRTIGLCQSANGGTPTFIGANRLTAVRVAEQAHRIAIDIAKRLDKPVTTLADNPASE